VAALVVGLTVFAAAPFIDERLPISRPWQVQVPILGDAYMSDGRGVVVFLSASAAGLPYNLAKAPMDRETGAAWVDLNTTMAAKVLNDSRMAAFGFRHALFNVNAVDLQALLIFHRDAPVIGQIDPVATNNTIEGNIVWLTKGDGAGVCILFTSDDEPGQFPPAINTRNMEAAAAQTGFQEMSRTTMPNGHYVATWDRMAAQCGHEAAGSSSTGPS